MKTAFTEIASDWYKEYTNMSSDMNTLTQTDIQPSNL